MITTNHRRRRQHLLWPLHQLQLRSRSQKQIPYPWLPVPQEHLATNPDPIPYHIRLMSCRPLTQRPLRLICHQNFCTRVGESSGRAEKIGLTFSIECPVIPCGKCLPFMQITDLPPPDPVQVMLTLALEDTHRTSTIQLMTHWVSTTDLTNPITL